jgi:hypothetical protein
MFNKLLVLCLLTPILLFAEEVTLTVEAISCEQPRPDLSDKKLDIPSGLNHIKEKLEEVHFKNFKLDSTQSITLPIKEKQKITLNNGDQLALEMLYLEAERIGLWINWQDSSGMELLDTRMHFDTAETMLAGAECEENKGKMLAVRVAPKAIS